MTESELRERAVVLGQLSRPRRRGWSHTTPVAGKIYDAVVRVVFPPTCAGCGVSGYWMCPLCDRSTERIDLGSVCHRCGRREVDERACSRCGSWDAALDGSRSAYLFDGAVRSMVHRLKYSGEFARAEWCGVEVARLAIELGWRPDLLVPVPLHRSRLRSRGYNQSGKIADVVARTLDVPSASVLTRTRATMSQVGLDAEHRRANVANAFVCSHDLTDLSVVLVDDVVTTGATLDACAVACAVSGARVVRALTLTTAS